MSAERRSGLLRRKRTWVALYLVLLAAHHLVAALPSAIEPAEGIESISTPAREGTKVVAGDVRIAFTERGGPVEPPVIFLHGSPGSGRDFAAVMDAMPSGRRLIAIDLPGFGHSTHDVVDYSFRAHAAYALALMDSLAIERAHVVGMSMGGGVALEMVRQARDRVASVALVAALGAQEFELLGSYEVNHALHGAQLAALWALDHCVPHFGLFDRWMLDLSYARNFYDSDQRPLRGVLENYDGPMIVVHGAKDFLVPVEAAREHARLVPQAELVILPDASHFLVWTRPAWVAATLSAFFDRVDAGRATVRSNAPPARLEAASQPAADATDFRAKGLVRGLLLALIVFGTFVTEDLTSVATGLLIAQGRLGGLEAVAALFCGIYFGDLLLYFAGRLLGVTLLRWPPFRWLVDEHDLRRATLWFRRRGFWAILLSRFVPGTRLPTYVAAGMVRAGFWRFAAYFFVAVALWTPLLVGMAVLVGQEALERFDSMQQNSRWLFLSILLGALILLRWVLPLASYEGRRQWVGRLTRWRRWEFWPAWRIYLPLALRLPAIARRQARRHSLERGGLRIVCACNPALPLGGLVDESKSEVLRALDDGGVHVARSCRIEGIDLEEDLERIAAFRRSLAQPWPLVLKPDRGERASGVRILRDEDQVRQALEEHDGVGVVQEYVPGPEFGIFYARVPGEERGRIISITRKRPLVIVGNGRDDLQRLILDHPRAVALADVHLIEHEDRLDWVPREGEEVTLTQVGTHSRGALFLDGNDLWSAELEAAVDALSRRFDGFDFGRYDVRGATEDELRRGEGFRVIELNGLSSECTHMYDPRYGFAEGQEILLRQWELAYRIGAARVARGARIPSWSAIVSAWWTHRKRVGRRPQRSATPSIRAPKPS